MPYCFGKDVILLIRIYLLNLASLTNKHRHHYGSRLRVCYQTHDCRFSLKHILAVGMLLLFLRLSPPPLLMVFCRVNICYCPILLRMKLRHYLLRHKTCIPLRIALTFRTHQTAGRVYLLRGKRMFSNRTLLCLCIQQ